MKTLFKHIYNEDPAKFKEEFTSILKSKIIEKIDDKRTKIVESHESLSHDQMVGIQELERLTSIEQFDGIKEEFLKKIHMNSVDDAITKAKQPGNEKIAWDFVDVINKLFKI